MWELKKILSGLVYPLGSASALLGFGLLLVVLRWRRWGIGLVVAGFAWLWVWSTPVFSEWVRWQLEKPWPHLSAEQAPEAEVIVILGGAFSHDARWPQPNASSSIDRYWHGARLFHAGKAPLVVLSGGRSPGKGPGMTEAGSGRQFLVDLGVPRDAVLVDEQALTTRDNAVNVASILEQQGVERFLLVTSALHMRRSMATFRAVGLEPIPAATDFEVRDSDLTLRDFLPSAAALGGSTRAVHEVVGYWVYGWRGWV